MLLVKIARNATCFSKTMLLIMVFEKKTKAVFFGAFLVAFDSFPSQSQRQKVDVRNM